jgi:thymidylate synthase (FAD)
MGNSKTKMFPSIETKPDGVRLFKYGFFGNSMKQWDTLYCNYGKKKFGGEISVIQPPGLQPETYILWKSACEWAESRYLQMIELGVAPQIARSVLPTCLKTEIVWTANFREWMHILKLRTSEAAHPQMREVAKEIQSVLMSECPAVFGSHKTAGY